MARQSRAVEERAHAADEAAQETGSSEIAPQRVARDYLHCQHPETGLDVVFIPGEALPGWVESR